MKKVPKRILFTIESYKYNNKFLYCSMIFKEIHKGVNRLFKVKVSFHFEMCS